MDELFMYFMKSSGVLLLFLSLYFLWLRKDTFFHGNRFFLLSGMLISLILPFLVITQYIEIPFTEEAATSNAFMFTETGTEVVKDVNFISWIDLILYTYAAGVMFFLAKFLIELASLCKLLWTSKITKRDGQFIYIETTTSFTPFSFFNYIVYNPDLYTEAELDAIITHEQAHSRQLHSIDVFISKLYCIFMWFNPLAWVHQKFISQNLEFLADSAAIKKTPSKKEYQLTLLKVSGNAYCPALTNNFYNSLIKKRIVMLQKNQSTHLNKWKQLLILPLLVAFVMLFNTEVIAKTTKVDPTPTVENTLVKDMYGDIMVTVDKNTTVKELKALQKMFKSFDITMSFDVKKFNSKKEIVALELELKEKAGSKASAVFESNDDKPIPTINLGRKNGMLIVSSGKHVKHVANTFTYEIHEDAEDNDEKKVKYKYVGKAKYKNKKDGTTKTWIQKDDVKTINIKKVDGKEVIIVNGKEVSPDEIKTIDIQKKDGKEVIIINGKELSPDEIHEEEIEIKSGSGSNYIFVGSDKDTETEDVEVRVNDGKESKIVIRNGGSDKDPLYVVDGKVVKKDKIVDLDPNKIESVSVLKGDSATKKYGDKGKDGVVEIITKK